MKQTTINYLLAAAVLFAVTAILKFTYRPYIYSNNIYDCHVADSFTDFFATQAVTFFNLAWIKMPLKKMHIWSLPVLSAAALILYEFIFSSTTDKFDMIASVLAIFPTAAALSVIYKRRFSKGLTTWK